MSWYSKIVDFFISVYILSTLCVKTDSFQSRQLETANPIIVGHSIHPWGLLWKYKSQIGNTRYIKYFRETKLSVMEVVGFDQSQWSIKRRRSQL
jgi:hypothetical protein